MRVLALALPCLLLGGCFDEFRTRIAVYGDTDTVVCGDDLTISGRAYYSSPFTGVAVTGGAAILMFDTTASTVTVLETSAVSDGLTRLSAAVPAADIEDGHVYIFSVEAGIAHDTLAIGDTMSAAEYDAAFPSSWLYTRATSAIVADCP